MNIVRVALPALVTLAFAGCAGAPPPVSAPTPLSDLRKEGTASSDAETVGRWALAEMFAPGGDAKMAATARARLDKLGATKGLYANLARAVADEAHGDPERATGAFLSTLEAAKTSLDPDAPLVAWYASHELMGLRGEVSELYARHKGELDGLLAAPGRIGWRALTELENWWAAEVFDRAEHSGAEYDALVAERMGCATHVGMAGPFGQGSLADQRRSFAAERPGPWPPAWPEDPLRATVPKILKTEQHRCLVAAAEGVADGVYYVETFFTTDGTRDLLVAVQGAVKVWVDDAPILERSPRDWGSWEKLRASITVQPGRHRVLARTLNAVSSVRLLNLDGTAAKVGLKNLPNDDDPAPEYDVTPPERLADPNPIHSIVEAKTAGSPLEAMLASRVAHDDGLDDVAAVLSAPLVDPDNAAALASEASAEFAMGDPALPEEVRERTRRALYEVAAKRDPKLWRSRTLLVLDDAEQRGLTEGVEPLRKMVEEFPNEPQVLEQLARLYGRLGWRGERMRSMADLARRFPDDVSALHMYLDALDEDGSLAEADKVATRIEKLDPDSEVDLDRAIARQDWRAAVGELERIGKRRPDRKEIATRIADIWARAGKPEEATKQLVKALAAQPLDAAARFRLADASYSHGDTGALRKALAEALQVGASATELRAAIDLIDGATDLEPYRIDGRRVIKAFESWEAGGKHMDGTAARVLDYAATWVHPDGSSEMLEHEIQRIQAQEAIEQESEMQPPDGLVLHLRVIKPDGSTLEPEHVPGKPTLTLPHLEVGDYIEMEHITSEAGAGAKGRRYAGPMWWFREADKGYWRSEFVVITPKDRALEIEARGNVPKPTERAIGTFVERRWRVDLSPPAIVEPESAPPTEFLPSVRVGWGITLEDMLARLVDLAVDEAPIDPRLHAKALEIVRGVPEGKKDERARLLYRYVVDKIQEGKEQDGRRVLFGGSGVRQAAFVYLLRALDIPYEFTLVRNKLAMPPVGKISEVEDYQAMPPLVRVETEKGPRWMLVRDKFAPYGYVPAEMRGQPGYRLIAGTPKETIVAAGETDAIVYRGRANVLASGAAQIDLVLSFSGNRGIAWRSELEQVPEGRMLEFFEKDVIAQTFDGGHVRDVQIENKTEVDVPLVVHLKVEVPELAKPAGKNLTIGSVFPMSLSPLAALPTRQTPLLRRTSWHTEVHFEVVFPDSMRMPASLPEGDARFADCSVVVKDSVKGHAIFLDRVIDLPAGRVQPGDEYAKYRAFVTDADRLIDRDILIGR